MGLLFYSFGFFPCVRVRCKLYPHGLTDLLFWFSPLYESLLRTVSTLAYCYTLLVFFLVQESVVDCIHTGLLFHSFGLFLCVRVRCTLYPNGFTVVLFWFLGAGLFSFCARCMASCYGNIDRYIYIYIYIMLTRR